jgi:hypothetical protein
MRGKSFQIEEAVVAKTLTQENAVCFEGYQESHVAELECLREGTEIVSKVTVARSGWLSMSEGRFYLLLQVR